VVDLNAVPNTGYHFVSWVGEVDTVANVNSATTTITMDANYTIEAIFEVIQLNIQASADTNGAISPSGEVLAYYGSDKQFTATANLGYEIDQWFVDGNSVQTGGTTYTLTNITDNHTVAVSFKILTYTVNASAGANGSIDPTGDITKDYGSSQLFTATPNTGYEVN
jgi:hypothetical protein